MMPSSVVPSAPAPPSARRRTLRRALELPLFALAAPLLGHMLFADDPLGLHAGFPWAAAAPLVFAARYGSRWGAACALLAAIGVALSPVPVHAEAPLARGTLGIATLALAVVIGDAAEAWRGRCARAEAENRYLRHRLTEFADDYHVLKVSHGQLEEFMAGQRLSLREALQRLRPQLGHDPDALAAGGEIMAVFAQFCSVQVAGLYAMASPTRVDPRALATHGDMGELPAFDPLLRAAVAERELASVRLAAHAADEHEAGLLAVVPIVDARDRLHGVLAIREMHFMAFQQENLNVLSLLGGYVGDLLARAGGLGDSRAGRFLAELDTSVRHAREHGVESALVCLRFAPHARAPDVAAHVAADLRSLDSAWLPPAPDGAPGVALLLPLVDARGRDACLERVARSVRATFDVDLGSLLLERHAMQLGPRDTSERCLAFIERTLGLARADGTASGRDRPAGDGTRRRVA